MRRGLREGVMRAANIHFFSRRRLLASVIASLVPGSRSVAQDYTGSITSVPPRLAMQGKLATRTEVLTGRNELPMISENSPAAFSDAIALYEEIAAGGGWPKVPNAKFLPAKKSKATLVLRQRLVREGYLAFDDLNVPEPAVFDVGMQDAVKAFQAGHGVATTGAVDARTLAEFNVPAEARLADLRENLGRLGAYLQGLGQRAILVNIPAVQLETVESGRVHSRHNVIAGKLERPTPTLASKVSDVVFNPFWNAPASIVARDIIPKFLADPSYLEQMQIRVFDGVGGPEIDPMTVDWRTTAPDRYHFQQQPGANNALATVKVNFPNKYMVYMHDTPHREIFASNARFESSGCVRVDDVRSFISWILEGQDEFSEAAFEMITASEEPYTMKVAANIDVRFMYLTAWASGDGRVNFRPDIYRLNGTGFVMGQPEPVG